MHSRRLGYIRRDRIGLMGFSHGGRTMQKAVLRSTVGQDYSTPFVAAVAFYPGCVAPTSALAPDTRILIGDADDWSSPAACRRWYDQVQRGRHELQLKVYPGAPHGFDFWHIPGWYAGHYTGRDPAAAADATALTREFFRAASGAMIPRGGGTLLARTRPTSRHRDGPGCLLIAIHEARARVPLVPAGPAPERARRLVAANHAPEIMRRPAA